MNRGRERPHTSECSSLFHTTATNPNKLARIRPSPSVHSILPRIPLHSASIRSHSVAKPARFDSNSPPSHQKSGVASCSARTPHPTVSMLRTTASAAWGSPFPRLFHAFPSPIPEAKPKRDDANPSANCPVLKEFPGVEAARRV